MKHLFLSLILLIYVLHSPQTVMAFQNLKWDVMYKDVDEDGINRNETFYDSPSNMLPAGPDRVAE